MPTMNYRSLGERSYSTGQILTGLLGLLTAAGLIAGGAIIIDQNKTIKDKISEKESSDMYNLLASVFIIVGSLMVLYGLFKMFTKS
jgi:uncharacterized membrane protein YidH (DUF202 family)